VSIFFTLYVPFFSFTTANGILFTLMFFNGEEKEEMGVVDDLIGVAVLAGGGYLVYAYVSTGGDMCKSALLGATPLCWAKEGGQGFIDFFTQSYNTGDGGVPFELDDCPPGWTNDGLTCREPISCGSGLDFFNEGCSGGNVVGRLNKQTCPHDHPDKVGLLCYKPCPAGWQHVEGMPYLCRDSSKGDFWHRVVGGAGIPFISDLFK
jgi:hypothetical protein